MIRENITKTIQALVDKDYNPSDTEPVVTQKNIEDIMNASSQSGDSVGSCLPFLFESGTYKINVDFLISILPEDVLNRTTTTYIRTQRFDKNTPFLNVYMITASSQHYISFNGLQVNIEPDTTFKEALEALEDKEKELSFTDYVLTCLEIRTDSSKGILNTIQLTEQSFKKIFQKI